MRRIFLAFVVCVVVATGNLSQGDDHSTEELNKIDILVPQSLDYVDLDPLTIKDIYTKPILVVTPSPGARNASFTTFYLRNGFRTIHHYEAFAWLQEFFKNPGLKALIFYPHLTSNKRFLGTSLSSIVIQNDMKMSDLVSIGHCYRKVPYVFVAPEDLFYQMNFENAFKVGDFKVYNDVIDAHLTSFEQTPLASWPFYRSVQETVEIVRKLEEIPKEIGEIQTGNVVYAQVQPLSATTGTGISVGRSDVAAQASRESAVSKESDIEEFAEAAVPEGIVTDSAFRSDLQEGIGAEAAHGSLPTGFGRFGIAGDVQPESGYGRTQGDLGHNSQSETYSREETVQNDNFLRTETELQSNIGLHSRIGGEKRYGDHSETTNSGGAFLQNGSFRRSDGVGSKSGVQDVKSVNDDFDGHDGQYKISGSLKVSPRMILSARSLIEKSAPLMIPDGTLDTSITEKFRSYVDGGGNVHPSGSFLQDGSSVRSTPDMVESLAEVHGEAVGNDTGSTLGTIIKTGAGIVGNVASGIVRTVHAGAEIVGNVASGAVKTGSAIVRTGTNIVGNVGTGVVKTGTEIVRTGSEIVGGVGSGIVHVGSDIVEIGSGVVENVGAGIVHAGTDIVRTGTGVVADVGSGIIKTGSEIVGTVSSDLVEKGNKIVGDVAKIVQSNINATAENVRREFTHHHNEPRQSGSISIRRDLGVKLSSSSSESAASSSSSNQGRSALNGSRQVMSPVVTSGISSDATINNDEEDDSSSLIGDNSKIITVITKRGINYDEGSDSSSSVHSLSLVGDNIHKRNVNYDIENDSSSVDDSLPFIGANIHKRDVNFADKEDDSSSLIGDNINWLL